MPMHSVDAAASATWLPSDATLQRRNTKTQEHNNTHPINPHHSKDNTLQP
jgi:hypothetical protein